MRKWDRRRLGLSTRTLTLAVGTVLAACQTTPAAAAVTTHFAVMRADGLVTRSSKTVVVERTYAVAFTTVPDISTCAFVATVGTDIDPEQLSGVSPWRLLALAIYLK